MQMALEQTWRWFGPKDPITLNEIRQTGATGVVTALHHIAVGEVWPAGEIQKRKELIESAGMNWSVVESLPVHEDIKKRSGDYQRYVSNYQESLRNLGTCGIDTVCYNFMPVLDWSRTNLRVEYSDGSITTKFEAGVFGAFDLCILKRDDAEKDYSPAQVEKARQYFRQLTDEQKKELTETILLGLPGSLEAYTLEQLRAAIRQYVEVGDAGLRANLYAFIKEIVPVAEKAGVCMAIHPDDPPWSLLGLPRVVSNEDDLAQILGVNDSPSNGLTLCTGSLGAGHANDLTHMAERFAPRINFIHLRNVSRNTDGDFLEEDHLAGDIDLFGVMKALVLEQRRRESERRSDRRMPFRPDHGHLMTPDLQRTGIYPGYSLFGRMRGLAELRGLELGIRRSLGM
jgi:mannonate dehydratase